MAMTDLKRKLAVFEESLQTVRLPRHLAGDRIVAALVELYGVKSAMQVLSAIGVLFPDVIRSVRQLVQTEEPRDVALRLPSPNAIKVATPKLLEAVSSRDDTGVLTALQEMGVLRLCPQSNKMFDRLEFCAGSVIGRARLLVLVELAIFAVEQTEYERATKYIAEAQGLCPGPSELHDLHTIEGIISLSTGNRPEARRRLAESIRVCQEDDFARVTCSVRVPNLRLAENFLVLSEQQIVITHLRQCQFVWLYLVKQINSWIDSIRNGERPEFLLSSPILTAMDRPRVKLRTLVIKASFLADILEKQGTGIRGSHIGFEKMQEEFKRRMAAAISGKLETGKN